MRHRWGDRPGREEFQARFDRPDRSLEAALAAIDAELADEDRLTSGPPDEASAQSTLLAATPWPAEPARPPFDRAGRYELGALLGIGAFGSVWRGDDPELGREVAIKLPRGGSLGTPDREERFLREARAAAQLRHPGIVAVYDVGGDRQTLYIVSELVRGISLARRLERGPLDPREAATLAAQVAEALDYAHGQGVVHRDIKPSNILLEGEGEGQPTGSGRPGPRARIVDFGLARSQADEVTMTAEGQILGTPAYMSPEQIRSPHAVDGRGDLYSLGVVLYQMLTGELPFRGSAMMLQVQVLQDDPTPPRRLNDRIPRDLETITLKCLAKEPSRRYQTPRDLADDLGRFLAGEPIRARPTGRAERLYRLCRRNPVTAGLAGLLVLAVLGGIVVVTWQWRRAEVHRRRAEANLIEAHKVVTLMISDLADKLDQRPGMEDYQRTLLERAREFYEAVALPQDPDPRLRLEAALAIGRVGHFDQRLGDLAKAEAAYDRARAILDSLVAEDPRGSSSLSNLAILQDNMAALFEGAGRWEEAERAHLAAIDTAERLVAVQAEEVDPRRGLAMYYNNLANFYQKTGRADRATGIHLKNVAIYRRLAADHPGDVEDRLGLARAHLNLAAACRGAGRLSDAEVASREAMGVYEALTARPAAAFPDRFTLGMIHCNLGAMYVNAGRTADAIAAFERAVEIYEGLDVGHSRWPERRGELGVFYHDLGEARRLAGRRDDARAPYERALAIRKSLVAEQPGSAAHRFDLALTAIGLGTIFYETGRPSRALPLLEEADGMLERLIQENPQLVAYQQTRPEALGLLGRLYRESGRTAEAQRAYRRARDFLVNLPALDADGLCHLAGVQAQCATLVASPQVDLDPAMDSMRRAVAAGFRDTDRLRRDTNLDPLRSRADFRMLAMDLAFPPDPFTPWTGG